MVDDRIITNIKHGKETSEKQRHGANGSKHTHLVRAQFAFPPGVATNLPPRSRSRLSCNPPRKRGWRPFSLLARLCSSPSCSSQNSVCVSAHLCARDPEEAQGMGSQVCAGSPGSSASRQRSCAVASLIFLGCT